VGNGEIPPDPDWHHAAGSFQIFGMPYQGSVQGATFSQFSPKIGICSVLAVVMGKLMYIQRGAGN